ncbi:hypothetical protein [Haloactinospora alba]|uniref:hypothetical protein n=1 Tax=Haloactinospora alba TaxID=405555 RepID=UPI00115216A9|nr:hypothetical protein [Haloactinospora alba]
MTEENIDFLIEKMKSMSLIYHPSNKHLDYSTDDINNLPFRKGEIHPPYSYIYFLKSRMEFSGPVDFPIDISYLACINSSETAHELTFECDFSVREKFFFSEHQGYIVWFFKEDGAVYRFGEDTEREEKLYSSFEEFLEFMMLFALSARSKRLAERERKNF